MRQSTVARGNVTGGNALSDVENRSLQRVDEAVIEALRVFKDRGLILPGHLFDAFSFKDN
jgi:hypothetical protein